ncbi:MAG: DUF5005 domain-containing protein [Desulfobacterales bacterium]
MRGRSPWKRPEPRRGAVLCLAALLLACAPGPRVAVAPIPEYDEAFNRPAGWVGGDGAHSIALGEGAVLWTFGDSLVGEVRGGRREIAFFVRNAVALQRGKTPAAGALSFHFGRTPAGGPSDFFPAAGDGAWRWPFHGLREEDGLHLFLLSVQPAEGPEAFAFSPAASLLALIENPADPPEAWRMRFRELPWGTASRRFGQAVLAEGRHALVYGTLEEKDEAGFVARHLLLARAPRGRIADFSAWEFHDGGGWSAAVERARPLLTGVAAEFSVSPLAAHSGYVLVASEEGLSPRVLVRFAPRPEGPWGQAIPVYSCPEAGRDARIFCYAAKGHPALSASPEELVVTYVANATDDGLLASRPELYRPRFLRLLFKPASGHSHGSSPETERSPLGP